jgi:ferric-dicitrate binding protein FerR (iron transport regulator)
MDIENIKVKPEWSKSKADIWNELFEHPDEKTIKRPFLRQIPAGSYAAILFVSLCLTLPFYTVTEKAVRGEYSVALLPDHSIVTLNAESKISYKPYMWFISRKVKLEGEACFEVKSGSRFHVQSGRNKVNVLGTTFNVYARPKMYCVTCLSGRVEVSADRETIVLNSGMQAICREQEWCINKDRTTFCRTTEWMQGKFVFVKTPLSEVVAEIERQYDIDITPASGLNYLYTGNFSKTEKPEDILRIIGKPFGITFKIE